MPGPSCFHHHVRLGVRAQLFQQHQATPDGVFSPLHLVAFAQNGAHCDVEPAVITHVPSKEERSTSAGRMVIKGTYERRNRAIRELLHDVISAPRHTPHTDQVGYAPPGLPSTSLCTTLREWQTFKVEGSATGK